MTTHVVPDGMKRKPTAEEWETLLENRIPELIRRAKAGNLDPSALNLTLQKVIEGELIGVLPAQTKPAILQLISGGKNIVIRATSGQRTIAQANDVFTWYFDPNFKNWGLDVPGEAKPETPVEVHEMVKGGDFKTIFGSLGRELDTLSLTQEQIVAFVEDPKNKDWLRTDGYATFFLLKVGNEFFVVYVGLDGDGGPGAGINRFSDAHVWSGVRRHRIVVPQALKPKLLTL